jgi:zinc transporter 1
MLSLTFSFFLVELIFGYITHSLALVSDSYHMLSDVVALGVGIASVRISKLHSQKNTYGWARAEVLGALVNSVFLIALCFTIFVEAIQRLTHTDEILHSDWMLYVGIAGLVINLLGLLLFHQHAHGHSHGGGGGGHKHSHSHGSHSHADRTNKEVVNMTTGAVATAEDKPSEKVSLNNIALDERPALDSSRSADPDDGGDESEDSDGENVAVNGPEGQRPQKNKIKSSAQLNMRGVFLHVLGDALGSLVVIVSAVIIKYADFEWKYKVDPAMSMVMVVIILITTIPLLKESALILMQTVPTHIQVSELKKKLINNVEGVLAVHEFHVWQLAGNRIIASAHIRCLNLRDYMRIAEEVKSFFHNEGIHSTTIQPEFVEFEEISPDRDCVLECGPDKTCYADTCCARTKRGLQPPPSSTGTVDPPTSLRQRANCSTPSQSTPAADSTSCRDSTQCSGGGGGGDCCGDGNRAGSSSSRLSACIVETSSEATRA